MKVHPSTKQICIFLCICKPNYPSEEPWGSWPVYPCHTLATTMSGIPNQSSTAISQTLKWWLWHLGLDYGLYMPIPCGYLGHTIKLCVSTQPLIWVDGLFSSLAWSNSIALIRLLYALVIPHTENAVMRLWSTLLRKLSVMWMNLLWVMGGNLYIMLLGNKFATYVLVCSQGTLAKRNASKIKKSSCGGATYLHPPARDGWYEQLSTPPIQISILWVSILGSYKIDTTSGHMTYLPATSRIRSIVWWYFSNRVNMLFVIHSYS